MLFTILKQFKEAITDYAIHGGWEIRFAKNDLQRRLLQTFIDNWPQYEHRICCKHLYNNLKKNHPVVLTKNLFWKAAKTTYKAKFDRLMDELRGIDEDAHSWLQDHSTTIWARHMFSEDGLSETVLNNMSKVHQVISYDQVSREQTKDHEVKSEICPKVLKRLHREKTASSRWVAC
nr:hypothetical protein CFP56_73970 [Quercus suber]